MADTIRQLSLLVVPVLLAITFHEVAHGWVADKLGDPSARLSGRLTFNPLKHLDLVGTLVFLLTRMIGWAKPVPVNPNNFRNPRRDMLLVALAGPLTNLALAAVSALVFRGLWSLTTGSVSGAAMGLLTPLTLMARASVIVNVGLAVFNILPIPPLDGSKVLEGILPRAQALAYSRLEPYGFLILLAVIFLGVVDWLIFPVIAVAVRLFLGGAL
ncbi:MAG: site-2 protease family protein [Thermodesulfobacteriota bacterium]|jgi:Zn-dependent protease